METNNPLPLNLIERFNRWMQESIMVKLFSIGFLILILLIPSSWIESVMYEREQRAASVISEVANKWSGSQTLSGPVLIIPYKRQEVIDFGKDGKQVKEYVERAFFLPETLLVDGALEPQKLRRGIFDVVVYDSKLNITASFTKPDFKKLSIADDMILWNEASIAYGISDLRGISDNPSFTLNGEQLSAEPSNNIGISLYHPPVANDDGGYYSKTSAESSVNGIVTKLNWGDAGSFKDEFKMSMNLKGSERLDFIPMGKTTEVKISGKWSDPSFDGEFLPSTREVADSAFRATWKILHFNRPFSQQWTEKNQVLSGSNFGVRLLVPVDQYQKSIRTAKYGVLIVLLTFMSLFLVEITQKVRIHPFQYILIGAALTIYYTLLLSFSEHLGFDLAYMISSLATVVLVALYSTTFFKQRKTASLFAVLLFVFYGFIYVIILQQDFSLLLGSIGLFAIIATLMYFSRKVKWYKEAPLS